MTEIRVNLYSDTQTQPTPAMRSAMAEAPVGDEQRGEDPSVNRLCEEVAVLLGKEAAVFLPSGTMCNEIALLVHMRPGDEVICDRTAHIVHAEGGGPAVLAGAMIYPLEGEHGIFGAAELEGAVRDKSRYAPRSRLAWVEQTSNHGGGAVWPLESVQAVAACARGHDLLLHLDGARLMNAVVASGVTAAAYAEPFDSVWIDLSKGLGCPVGGVLAGSSKFIHDSWRWKQRLGGAMRQAGIVAAAGLYALENNVERLAEDHANARHFAERIAAYPGLKLESNRVDTNIVFVDVTGIGRTAVDLAEALQNRGVRIGVVGSHRMRAVTHFDVDRAGADEAAEALAAVLSGE